MDTFPLLAEQETLLFLNHLLGPGVAHNLAVEHPLPADADPGRVAGLVDELVRRQGALRSAIAGAQQAYGPVDPALVVSDVDDVAGAIRGRLAALYYRELHPPAVPRRARFELLRDGRAQVLLVLLDHLASDGLSLGVLADQLERLRTVPDRQSAPADYRAFCRRRADEVRRRRTREIDVWRRALRGVPPLRGLFPSHPPGPWVRTHRDSTYPGGELPDRLRRLNARLGTPAFTTVATLTSIALWRRTGQRDFVIQTPVSTRRTAEADDVVGYLINDRPIVCRIDPDRTLAEHAGTVWRSCVRAFRNSYLSVPELLDAVPEYRATLDADDIDYVQLHVTTGSGRLPGSAAPDAAEVRRETHVLGPFTPARALRCTTLRFDFAAERTSTRAFLGGSREHLGVAADLCDDVVNLLREAGADVHRRLARLGGQPRATRPPGGRSHGGRVAARPAGSAVPAGSVAPAVAAGSGAGGRSA
ncbi:MAG TPA: condensation domain-containing protein [Pilimelia sp.]|nr:condensation domain-containing protein [Pilimelia sp.]